MTTKYEKISAEVIEKISSDDRESKVKYPEKYITPDLCEKLDMTIRSFISLDTFRKHNAISRTVYVLLLQYVLPLLFTPDTIQAYFLKMLVEVHNCLETWEEPGKSKDFQKIVGLTLALRKEDSVCGIHPERYEWVERQYLHVYDTLFTFEYQYPQECILAVIDSFENQSPLVHAVDLLNRLYCNHNFPPVISFVADVLLPRYTDDQIRAYFDTMIQGYLSTLPYYKMGTVYLEGIVKYIFGTYFSHNTFHPGNQKSFTSKNFQLKSLLLRSAFPFVYVNYYSNKSAIYKMMGLSDEEVQDYESRFYSVPVTQNRLTKTKSPHYDGDYILPQGTKLRKIFEIVVSYYKSLPVDQPVPNRRDAYIEISNRLKTPQVKKDFLYVIRHAELMATVRSKIEDCECGIWREKFGRNESELSSEKNQIEIVYEWKSKFHSRTISYMEINGPIFRDEARSFARVILSQKISQNNISKVKVVIDFMGYMYEKFRVSQSASVTSTHILLWLHELQLDGQNPSSITSKLGVIKLFFEVLNSSIYKANPINNPAMCLHFWGTKGHITGRPEIPDDILVFLDSHIDELSQEVSLLYRLMRSTCWRFDDAANIRVTDVYEIGESEYGMVRTIVQKTRKQRYRHNVGDYLEDVVERELFDDLLNYIAVMAPVREIYTTDYVFFTGIDGMANQLTPQIMNNEIDQLLNRYGITSIDETYSGFSTSQTRVTGSSALINAGVPLPIIQSKLGHLNRNTTETHYARVHKKQLAELDAAFFKKKFGLVFDEEKIDSLTIEQRRILYREFISQKREVEFGQCIKMPGDNENTCKNEGFDCPTCSKIITGPKYLSKWYELLNSSDKILDEMITIYNSAGILESEYNTYVEYKQELKRNQQFRCVIEAIESNMIASGDDYEES